MRRWQLFLGIELALTLWLFFQIITNPMALTTILVGVFFLFLGARWHRLRSFNVAFGGILLVLGIFINPAIWLILMIAGVFIIMVVTKPGMGFSAWDRKQYVAPVTQEPSEKPVSARLTRGLIGIRFRQPMIGMTLIWLYQLAIPLLI